MQFSKNWLYEWVKLKSTPYELTQKLTMAGLEVDSVSNYSAFKGVIVAQVDSMVPHPSSDTLNVCQLKTGAEGLVQVVTGAPNVKAGDKVCFAPVGTHLPALHKPNESLEVANFKGVESLGMLLSTQEMGLTDKADELMILSQQAPVGEQIWEYLHLDDVIFDLDITPNRGDCLSIQGIAREVHALTKAEFVPVKVSSISPLIDDEMPVHLNAAQACPRYCGRVIRGVDCSKSTPDWMVEKLRRSHIRSINPVVDIMNFIMIELGQPMHAFDMAQVKGSIHARMSKLGESITLLDGQTLTIDHEDVLMIADDEKPLAIAGIMGGLESGVTNNTQDIFLESAFFAPEAIAGRGRKLGVHSDSSFRFERGVDPMGQTLAIERATQWILDICGGQPGPIIDVSNEHLPRKEPIILPCKQVNTLLGVAIDTDEMIADLKRLQCEVTKEGDVLTVQPPAFRFDLSIPEDLVEEIARVKGYDNIEASLPAGICKPKPGQAITEQRVNRLLIDLGYHEVITYSFVDSQMQAHFEQESPVVLANPITADMSVMRQNMWPGLVRAAKHNMHRQQANICLFEMGLVFKQTKKGLQQTKKLGGLCSGMVQTPNWRVSAKPYTFFDVKAHIEQLWQSTGKGLDKLTWESTEHPGLHPGQTAKILADGKLIGIVGAMHPKLEAELDLLGPVFLYELDVAPLMKRTPIQFKKPSMYPAVRRDLSFLIDEQVSCAKVCEWLKKEGGHLLQDIIVFDIYQKDMSQGRKSMALGLIWQDAKRTLVDTDIDEKIGHLVQGLKQQFDAQLRD